MDAISAATARYQPLKGQFRFLKSLAPWLIYAGVFFGPMSVYCYFSYVEPVMTEPHRIHNVGYDLDYGACRWKVWLQATAREQTHADKFGMQLIVNGRSMMMRYRFSCPCIVLRENSIAGILILIDVMVRNRRTAAIPHSPIRQKRRVLCGGSLHTLFNLQMPLRLSFVGCPHYGLGLASPALVFLGANIAASALLHGNGRTRTVEII